MLNQCSGMWLAGRTRKPDTSPQQIQANFFFFFLNIYLFIYLFLAALGLRCCARAFSSCGERGLLFIAVCGLLIAVACHGARALGA